MLPLIRRSSVTLLPSTDAVEVEEVTFKRPVNVGDLIKFRSQVLHTWVSPDQPDQASRQRPEGCMTSHCAEWWNRPEHASYVSYAVRYITAWHAHCMHACAAATMPTRGCCCVQGMAYVQVQASVTQPEKRQR